VKHILNCEDEAIVELAADFRNEPIASEKVSFYIRSTCDPLLQFCFEDLREFLNNCLRIIHIVVLPMLIYNSVRILLILLTFSYFSYFFLYFLEAILANCRLF